MRLRLPVMMLFGSALVQPSCFNLDELRALPGSSAMDAGAAPPRQIDWSRPAPAAGCSSTTGYVLTAKAVACPGVFSAGQMTSRCAAGWSLCPTNPLSATQAAAVPALFIGAAHGSQLAVMPDASMRCQWAGSPQSDEFFLFGVGGAGRHLVHDVSSGLGSCGGYPSALECVVNLGGGPTPWLCSLSAQPSEADALLASNPFSADGVLCCAP